MSGPDIAGWLTLAEAAIVHDKELLRCANVEFEEALAAQGAG